jgi:hypothetical protein
MVDHRITCIIMSGSLSEHKFITHIGNSTGAITKEEAVQRIDARTDTFHVIDPYSGKRANVGVVREAGKAPYLRTYADNTWNDNLLSLTSCPL